MTGHGERPLCCAGALWAAALCVLVAGGPAGAADAGSPAPAIRRPVDETEAVLTAVRSAVAAFRATPSPWFRVEFRRRIALLHGAKVFAVTRLAIPETHGLVALAPDGPGILLGSDWTDPCAPRGFNALVDPAQVKLAAPGGAAAFARAYLALMHTRGARLVEKLADIADPDTDEYRDHERDVMGEIEEKYKGLIRPVLRGPATGGSAVSFYVWVKSELQRWEMVVNEAGQVTACEFLRIAGVPADHIR
ncbi:MAG TPA: hypothetical protein VIG69_04370 [Candidatus Methylomirabilis sp.]